MRTAFDSAGLQVFERGWLSSNNVLFAGGEDGESVLVDTGYCTHSEQTVGLVRGALGARKLERIVNTHLHSDHCGGNAALQEAFGCRIDVPAGEADAVDRWDIGALSYTATQQQCPRFSRTGAVASGESVLLGGRVWRCLSAPGHDPQAIILFDPELRILLSGDALWQNGFGVVFPEIEGQAAFGQVAETLDLIEQLGALWIVPGHGSPFRDVTAALLKARQRLEAFVESPIRHARHAAKVLIKFHLLEVKHVSQLSLLQWMRHTPYLSTLHRGYFMHQVFDSWGNSLLDELIASGAAKREEDLILDV